MINVNNFFIKKSEITKDGDVSFRILTYLTQTAKLDKYKILSVSVVSAPNEKYMITVVTENTNG